MDWHTAIDWQIDTSRWLRTEPGTIFTAEVTKRQLMDNVKETPETEISVVSAINSIGIQEAMYRGDLFFIESDMQDVLIQAAHDLPDEIELRAHDLLSNQGLMVLAKDEYGHDSFGRKMGMRAILWDRKDTGIHVAIFGAWDDPYDEIQVEIRKLVAERQKDRNYGNFFQTTPPLLYFSSFGISFDKRMPSHLPSPYIGMAFRLLFAAFYLAQQRISVREQNRPIPRGIRKRRERWQNKTNPVTVISLRRKKNPARECESTIEYSHRWVVRGHWRHQWHPSTSEHKWRYIYEYVKGPEDKPLKVTERRVFDLKR